MDEGTVRQLAGLYALQAEIEALKVERHGMQLANTERHTEGHASAYGDDDFMELANRIRAVGQRIADEI